MITYPLHVFMSQLHPPRANENSMSHMLITSSWDFFFLGKKKIEKPEKESKGKRSKFIHVCLMKNKQKNKNYV